MHLRFAEIHARFAAQDKRFEAVDAQFVAVHARLEVMDERFNRVGRRNRPHSPRRGAHPAKTDRVRRVASTAARRNVTAVRFLAVIQRSHVRHRILSSEATTFRSPAVGLAIASLFVFAGGGAGQTPRPGPCATITAENIDDCVRLNQIQVLGTHNSYHIAPKPEMLAALGRARGTSNTPTGLSPSNCPSRHPKVRVEFCRSRRGPICQASGAAEIAGLDPPGPELLQPRFKVIHMVDVDYRTVQDVKACLRRSGTGRGPIRGTCRSW